MAFVSRTILLFLISLIYYKCISEKVTYISVEHPRVTYCDPKFMTYLNLTTRRYGRRNPIYYVGVDFLNVVPFDNTVLVDFYIFEWLTNVYKRSFIEFHYTWCSLVEKDMFFGSAMRQGKLLSPCPHMPGVYHLENMTINPAFIPPGFPFTRGRIYCNISQAKTKARMCEGHIDMKVAQLDRKDAKKMLNF